MAFNMNFAAEVATPGTMKPKRFYSAPSIFDPGFNIDPGFTIGRGLPKDKYYRDPRRGPIHGTIPVWKKAPTGGFFPPWMQKRAKEKQQLEKQLDVVKEVEKIQEENIGVTNFNKYIPLMLTGVGAWFLLRG